MLETYGSLIAKQETLGTIERVENDVRTNSHYLNHFPVIKELSPSIPIPSTPMRAVYACNAKSGKESASLNDCLETGEKLQNDMLGILLRWRVKKIAMVSDIQRAFHMISVDEPDRNYMKFFWLSDFTDPNSPLIVFRFCVVIFGSNSSSFILGATVKYHLSKYPGVVSADILHNIFVDNVPISTNSETYATEFFSRSREILSAGNFNLRAWASNYAVINDLAAKEDVLLSDIETVPVLGLLWNTVTDELSLKPFSIDREAIVTKRYILSTFSKLFDPCGLVSCVMVRCKILMQDLFIAKIDWDTEIPSQYIPVWNDIVDDILSLFELRIPRVGLRDFTETKPYSLHVFGDFSKRAIGLCAYLCDGLSSFLIRSTSRVAPINCDYESVLSCPRGELTASYLGSLLAKYLKNELSNIVVNVYLWTDSQVVLRWFNNYNIKGYERKLVKEIKGNSDMNQWYYCPSEQNPSDLNSRGISVDLLTTEKKELWFHGPKFILLDKSCWPKPNFEIESSLITDAQASSFATEVTCNLNTVSLKVDLCDFNVERFSKFDKLVRVTAYVRRVFKRNRDLGCITEAEMTACRGLWIKQIQAKCYSSEINLLLRKKSNNYIRQLDLFIDDDGFLRSAGRIQNAPLDYNAKFPLLLPPRH